MSDKSYPLLDDIEKNTVAVNRTHTSGTELTAQWAVQNKIALFFVLEVEFHVPEKKPLDDNLAPLRRLWIVMIVLSVIQMIIYIVADSHSSIDFYVTNWNIVSLVVGSLTPVIIVLRVSNDFGPRIKYPSMKLRWKMNYTVLLHIGNYVASICVAALHDYRGSAQTIIVAAILRFLVLVQYLICHFVISLYCQSIRLLVKDLLLDENHAPLTTDNVGRQHPVPNEQEFLTWDNKIALLLNLKVIPSLKSLLTLAMVILGLLLVGLVILSWKNQLHNSLCWFLAIEIGLAVSSSLWGIGSYNTLIEKLEPKYRRGLFVKKWNWVINKNYLIVTAISIAVSLYGRLLWEL